MEQYPNISNSGSTQMPVKISVADTQALSNLNATDVVNDLTLMQSNTLSFHDLDVGVSPDMMTDDGIFLPGSKYQELHKTLRTHVFHTARSAEASRQATPPPNTAPDLPNLGARLPYLLPSFDKSDSHVAVEHIKTVVNLTPQQENLLWKNWIVEISAWASTNASRQYNDGY